MGNSAMRKYLPIILLALLCIGAGRMYDYGDTDLYGEGNIKFAAQVESQSTACSGTYTTARDTLSGSGTAFKTWLTKHTLGCAGTITEMYAYISWANTSAREIKLVVYDNDGGSGEPSTKEYESAALFNAAWNSSWGLRGLSGISQAIDANTDGIVWVGIMMESADTQRGYDLNTGNSDERSYVSASFVVESPWPHATDTHTDDPTQISLVF
jgi:hypothetical protein